jgi:poly-gamma-glutamate capsule biosynthesis protein CapA/YwtB (metallophosphatase superfamily)
MSTDRPPVAARFSSFARRRPAHAATALAAVVLALPVAAVAIGNLASGDAGPEAQPGRWVTAPSPLATPGPTPTPTHEPGPREITLSAVGDIIMGDAGRLPPGDGDGFFDGVADALAADLVMGNLEQPLTGDTGFRKCAEDSTACHAFRAPPRYAAHLRDAGFHLMNLANNHGNDYGPQGRANTRAVLDEHGIVHTGELDQIAEVEVRGVSVAVVGFSPYAWTNSLTDLAQAADVVARAADRADLVVVQVHMGAEGTDQTRVRPGTETFHGENRGDPMAFARAVIDAGADLVVGHGPHVLRGLEFHQGRLIAYSLGNFAGAGVLGGDGILGLGAVLRVTLAADGGFVAGQLVATHMYGGGLPDVDSRQRGLDLVLDVTARDFPDTGPRFGADGEIIAPSADGG